MCENSGIVGLLDTPESKVELRIIAPAADTDAPLQSASGWPFHVSDRIHQAAQWS